MQVLVVGSGGREHALVWKIAQSSSVDRVWAAPGSHAIGDIAECMPDVSANDTPQLLELCRSRAVDLVVIGPEDPLAAGLGDSLRDAGFAVFGPSREAARLESSKSFAKAFMDRHAIPTAGHASFEDAQAALAHARGLGGRCVVKADGLAAGKGVAMCSTLQDAEVALREIMGDRRFGDAGDRVVIEEWLEGEEASYYAITDGERIVTLAAAQDHKRALDDDRGENTGGMGAYSPAPVLSPEVEARVLERVVRPTVRGMASEGRPYSGVLYVGLMIDAKGDPWVIEYNVRFGDPETQALLVRLQSDFVPLLEGAAQGELDESIELRWDSAAVCVVAASDGYPRSYETGKTISGLDELRNDSDVVVFHAGTRRAESGGFETAGGRVVGITARGASVRAARDAAYSAAGKLHFEGMHIRRDIAARALTR